MFKLKSVYICFLFISFVFSFQIISAQEKSEIQNQGNDSDLKTEAADVQDSAKKEANYLLSAYRKEFSFLENERKALMERLDNLNIDFENRKSEIQKRISDLEKSTLSMADQIGANETKISELEDKNSKIDNIYESVSGTIEQAALSLENYGVKVEISGKQENIFQEIEKAFSESLNVLEKYSSIYVSEGSFFSEKGDEIKGKIVHIGEIGSLGVSDQMSGTLAPAGSYKLKIWNRKNASEAISLSNASKIPQLPVFLYNSLKTEAQIEVEKSLYELIESGGLIAWIIIWIGIVGGLMIVYRIGVLFLSSSRTEKIIHKVTPLMQNKQIEEAKSTTKRSRGVAAKVIHTTLSNINAKPEDLENSIIESILLFGSRLDIFESSIKIIAAISPLLGLLGTVTGMIATFDVITTYGTGDPKMLSGGISEALVTTQLGLAIAIPLLVCGTLLSGWSERIKGSMEASALRVTNIHKGFQPSKVA